MRGGGRPCSSTRRPCAGVCRVSRWVQQRRYSYLTKTLFLLIHSRNLGRAGSKVQEDLVCADRETYHCSSEDGKHSRHA